MMGLGLPHGTAQAATGWTASYYSKTNLTGHKVNAGPYATLNFNWGSGSPKSGVPKTNFSAIFQKRIYEYAGTYDLQVRTSQGVRVYVDGKLKINHWAMNKGSYWHTPIQLSKGYHSFVVKYFKTTGKASLSLNLDQLLIQTKSYTPPKLPIASDQWYGEIFPSQNLTGHPKLVGSYYTSKITSLNFNWGKNAPASGFPKDHFSAIYQRQIVSPGGNYKFNIWADDGVQVYVDNKLQYNAWHTGVHSYTMFVPLSKGTHTILVKYFENTGYAHLRVDTSYVNPPAPPKLPMASDQWYGEIFPSQYLTGYPKLVGTNYTSKISNLSFNWGTNAPLSGMPKDHFSAIFQRQMTVTGGNYNLSVSVDDGIQVYIDNILQLNEWKNHNGSYTKQVALTKGTHTILVKYFENTGYAHLKVDLSYVTPPVTKPTQAPTPAPSQPTTTPAPAPTPTVSIPLTTTEWNGAYYPSQNLTGTAVLVKNTSFNYSWGTSAPSSKIPSGPFSAIFQKNVAFDGNPTDLEIWANNGFQVYLDDKLVMDHWTNTADSFWHQIITPSSGTHKVVVKYVKKNSTSSLRFETGSPYRTLDLKKPASLSATDITNFFNHYNANSPLKADAQQFIDAQNTYGVNAAYLAAHAILETGWGKSSISQYKHNLYGYSAYDLCPFTCAYYFPNDPSSINLVAYDVAGNYLNPKGSYYLSQYGPNLIGMNVNYASGSQWYSTIANLMEEIQPYNTDYYAKVGEKQVVASQPGTYGRDIPGTDLSGNEVNFPSGTTATLTTNGLSLRTLPLVTQSTYIQSIPQGTTQAPTVIKVLGYNKDVSYHPTSTGSTYQYHWYRVQYGNNIGWVYGYYLTIQNLLYVNATDVLIRSTAAETFLNGRPTLSNAYVQPVLNPNGTPVTQNGYYKIKVPNSTQIGWIPVKYTEIIKQ